MFNFDDRYIILVIILPGLFLLANIYVALFLYFSTSIDFGKLEITGFTLAYGLVVSLILGSICWWIQNKKWIIDPFDTTVLLKSLSNHQVNGKDIDLKEIEKRYEQDFEIPLIKEGSLKYQKNYLKGSLDNIFFTMNRAFGLEKPSAYRLLIDALSSLIISILLSGIFLILIASLVYFLNYNFDVTWKIEIIIFAGLLAVAFITLKLWVVPSLREYYHYTLFMVYLDKQYRTKIEEFIYGNKTRLSKSIKKNKKYDFK